MRDIPCRTFRSTNHTVPYLGLLTTVAGNITTLELRAVSGPGRKATWGASPRACIYFPDAAGIYANKCRAYGHRQSAALSGPGLKSRAALTAHHQGGKPLATHFGVEVSATNPTSPKPENGSIDYCRAKIRGRMKLAFGGGFTVNLFP